MTRLSASIRKLQRALMTTVFNGAGEGSAKASWVLMRRTRADTFRSANRRKNLHRFSMLHVAEPKNLTCIGPHPRTQKNQRFQSWKPAMSGGLNFAARDALYAVLGIDLT